MSHGRLETHLNYRAHVGPSMSTVKSPTMGSAPAVDMTSGTRCIPQLQSCETIAEAKNLDSPLFLDVSQCGVPLPLPDYTRVHLKFPSTLLRRPKFQFPQLVRTLDHSTQDLLASEVDLCSTFVFYDEGSTLQNCSSTTSQILDKTITHLLEVKNGNPKTRFVFLQAGKSNSPTPQSQHSQQIPYSRPPALKNSKSSPNLNKSTSVNGLRKHNLNLKITIPNRNSRVDNSNYMFVQSFKKDTIHYSPDSLQKYFTFHMPPSIRPDDDTLPRWLKNYSKDGNENLQQILKSFECLEQLEIRRLESCLQSSSKQGPQNGGEDLSNRCVKTISTGRPRLPKLYSFRKMQKQYKPNRHDYDSDNDEYNQPEEGKLKMDIHEELHDGENRDIRSKLTKINGSQELLARDTSSERMNKSLKQASESQDEDEEDVLETPMDDYLMTCGIQSFTKNRYSNILPYEHSRVKLEPSPIGTENKHGILSTFATPASSPPLSTQALRKRRNSYFSQDGSNREKSLDALNEPRAETGRSNLRLPATSFDHRQSITTPNTAIEHDQFNDYFNANYLKIPQINPEFSYIATQAPLPSTLDDFWKVVITNGVKVILSLNSDDELSMRKWDIYWNSSTLKKFDVAVEETYENVGGVKGCILRVFKVKRNRNDEITQQSNDCNPHNVKIIETEANGTIVKKSKAQIDIPVDGIKSKSPSDTHTVCQLQYTKWLDSCGIVLGDVLKLHRIKNLLVKDSDDFIESIKRGETYEEIIKVGESSDTNKSSEGLVRSGSGSPLLVHCSAGCGRTGVFITLDYLLNVLEHPTDTGNRIDVWNIPEDLVFIIVNELRKQRISMVQNLTQYITCYEAILKYFELRKTTGSNNEVI
ncbi:LADA_0C08064g1_1 [Lachancea dasiensis]|uniref:LADA_0C08064g1_1 n=1 Tax=Lachancea dasiensis TaxID=1072105 RepID=A0A1G4J064_9SACH|nr:LADA_0C08064g1_1 [Lachancea dasiensis]